MGRSLNDDLVGADAAHPVEHADALAIDDSLDMESGVLVRDDPEPPSRPVREGLGGSHRVYFVRGHVFVPLVERADAGFTLRFGGDEVGGAFPPFGCNNDPTVDDRVFSEF